MPEALYVQDDDPAVPDRLVTDAAERAALMADVAAGARLSGVETLPGRTNSQRVILNAANEATQRQQWTDTLDAATERRSRTFQVFRRPPNVHAKSPPEVPELVTLGDVGDTFSVADLAQIQNDLGATRLEPLP